MSEVSQKPSLFRKPLSPTLMKTFTIGYAFVVSALITSVVILRTGVTADAGIFIRMQSGWASGLVLYEEVFDIKDFGFFALNAPFFRLWGVPGLVVAALVWTLIFIGALYFVCRSIIRAQPSLLVSLTLGLIWVSGSWFMPLYTEVVSAALLSLGIALIIQQKNLISGLVLGLVVAVKLILVIPVFAVILYMFLISLLKFFRSKPNPLSPPDKRGITGALRSPALVIVGLGVGFTSMVTLAALVGSLRGWLEVFETNRAYQESTGIGIFDYAGLVVLIDAIFSNSMFAISLIISVLSVLCLLLFQRGRTVLRRNRENLSLLAVAFLGTAWASKLQNAAGFHSQVAFSVLLLTLALCLSMTLLVISEGFVTVGTSVVMLCAVALAVFAYSNSWLFSYTPGVLIEKWRDLERQSSEERYLSSFPTFSSVSISLTSGPRFYYSDAKDTPLSCRFHLSHPLYLHTHRQEIESCWAGAADVVVWEDTKVYGEWFGYATFWDSQRAKLFRDYRICAQFEPSKIIIFARPQIPCPALGA
jgi:hypothetical protein